MRISRLTLVGLALAWVGIYAISTKILFTSAFFMLMGFIIEKMEERG